MNEPVSSRRIVRFGVFEVDLASEELRKNGLKIRLSGQPFQILAMLLDRPGEVVTREELQKKLWPDGTFVDFDHSLNTAVNKIREALADSAETPRFVETLARRGYRFIAPVENPGLVAASLMGKPVQGEHTNSFHIEPIPSSSPRPEPDDSKMAVPLRLLRADRKFATSALIGFLLLGVAAAFWWSTRRVAETPGPLKLKRLTSDVGLTTDAVISPDGKLVAYASDRAGNGNLDIWIKHTAGGEPIQLTRDPADEHQPHFSPDGGQIVFRSEREGGGIYVIATLGGTAQLLAKEGRNPRFSPDGKSVAYFIGNIQQPLFENAFGKIYVIAAGGGSPRRIGSDSLVAGYPVWSPGGKHLLLKRYYGRPPEWLLTPLDGGPEVPTGAFERLRQQFSPRPWDFSAPAEWHGDQILFHVKLDDSVNLWRIGISPKSGQVVGPVERLTSGTGLEIHPSIAMDGTLVFSSLLQNEDLWSLPMNTREGTVLGPLQQLTHDLAADRTPALFADGKRMLFASSRTGNFDIWVKDLQSGKEMPLKTTSALEARPLVSPDQSQVVFLEVGERPTAYVMPVDGGLAERVCEGQMIWNWSADSRGIIIEQLGDNSTAGGTVLYLLELSTRRRITLLNSSLGVFQPGFSTDNRWIAFGATRPPLSKSALFIAPYRPGIVIADDDWICVGDDSAWVDKPRWSPDGNLLYFVSQRDGFACLWAQRLEPATKRPRGVAFPIYHFHDARRSMLNVGYSGLELSVASDKIAFSMGEFTGNIWMTKLDLK